MQWVEALQARLPERSAVLDLGCGGGGPATRSLAERHDLLGVDISERQLERARRLVPKARFLRADATEVELERASFDAVVSLFLLGHVPRAKQRPLVERIFDWLRPGGWFLGTLGTAEAADEIVDPRPYCEILRQWSTLHPEFAFLPRKFKIAVSGAVEDRAAIAWHDIGLQLLKNDAGETGFKVLAGGGMVLVGLLLFFHKDWWLRVAFNRFLEALHLPQI